MDGAKFCASCGAPVKVVAATALPPTRSEIVQPSAEIVTTVPPPAALRLNPLIFTVIGVALGALIGFQMRPSMMFIGQLPFQTVITRGAGLQGIDQLLISTAQQSFNVLAIAVVLGGAVGFAVSHLVNASRGAR